MQEERQRTAHQSRLAMLRGDVSASSQQSQQQGAGEEMTRHKPAQRLKPHERVSVQPKEAQEIVLPDDVTVSQLASLLGGASAAGFSYSK